MRMLLSISLALALAATSVATAGEATKPKAGAAEGAGKTTGTAGSMPEAPKGEAATATPFGTQGTSGQTCPVLGPCGRCDCPAVAKK